MLKIHLSIFAFLSAAVLVLLLSYSKDSTLLFFTNPYLVANEKDTFSCLINEQAQLKKRRETQMPTTTSKTLGRCPDTPPNLLGPIHVEFDSNRTLDEVRKEVSPLLQDGGLYKPPDCIAQQKVGPDG